MSFNNNQPPDLQDEFSKIINDLKKNFKSIGAILVILIVVIGGSTTFYTVQPSEEAVVLRFGKYVGTYPPGLHFKFPLGVDQVIKVQTKKVHQAEFGFRNSGYENKRSSYNSNYDLESLMLTGDLNVADVKWVVQYQIADPFNFLFKTSSPERNIRDISESIMRRVVGDRLVTEILTTGRTEIAVEAKVLMQEVLERYNMGVNVLTVKLQDVNPPDLVKPSFNEVNEAKQEQEKMINQAEQAYNKIIPEAKGKADKLLSEAEGFSQAIVNRSLGDAEKFEAMLREYRRAPSITKKRMYIETMEEVFSKMEDLTIVDSKVKGLLPIFNQLKEK